jgi:hypothetical protein
MSTVSVMPSSDMYNSTSMLKRMNEHCGNTI